MKALDSGTGKKIPSLSPPYVLADYCALKCGLFLPATYLFILSARAFYPAAPESHGCFSWHHFPFDVAQGWMQLGHPHY